MLDEARLFFDYLSGEYSAALASLETLESRTTKPADRLRILSMRAQIALGQGKRERADETIAYLQAIEGKVPLRYEDTPAGPSLIEEPTPGQGWPKYLASRAKKLRAKETDDRIGQGNNEELLPDAMPPFAPRNFGQFPREPAGGRIEIGDVQVDDPPRLPRGPVPIPRRGRGFRPVPLPPPPPQPPF
jgi:hypothetical protein